MRMNIAICDDDIQMREYLEMLVRKQNTEFDITKFSHAEEYLKQDKKFDILLLDIEMSGTSKDTQKNNICMNGMELAKKLRESSDKQTVIIFVTGYEDYVYDAFDVSAFQYLLKPVDEERFARVLERAVQTIKQENEQEKAKQTKRLRETPYMISVQYAGITKTVTVDMIYYVESRNHKIILHTKDKNIEYYAKLGDLEQKLAGKFYRIHKGYLVNLAYVDEYSKTELTLVNGTKLLISKYKYSEFVKAYLRYMED